MAVCPVCLGERFAVFATIDFGGWEAGGDGLQRWSRPFELGRCAACAHVMITTAYTEETFRSLYFDTPQDPVFWSETMVGSTHPYADMVAFCRERIERGDGLLLDVGCGPGLLLRVLHEEYGEPLDRLLGVDFNRRLPEPYPFIQADLARLGADGLPGTVAVAFASHILEHLADPRAFLHALGGALATDGLIYVEVPDNRHVDPAIVGDTNLINPQHIHYFCEESLTRLAEGCGLTVVRRERSVLGAMPRLRMLLGRAGDPGTADAIARSLALLARRRAILADSVIAAAERDGTAGLWGIGADFHRLLKEHPAVAGLVAGGRVALFDQGLAGRRLTGRTIRPLEDIRGFGGTVFLVPLLGDTRLKMRRAADAAGFPDGRVVDPWISPR